MDRVYNKAYIRGAEYNWTIPYFANVQVPFIKGKTFRSHNHVLQSYKSNTFATNLFDFVWKQ